MDIETTQARTLFIRELRKLLPNLYNPGLMRHSPLIRYFGLENRRNAPSVLQHILIKAIDTLEPGEDCPVGSTAWRVYQVLHGRYIDQFSQEEVARDLFLSPRQLRRLEHSAVEVLADQLWSAHNLQLSVPTADEGEAGGENDNLASSGPSGQDEELAWLERTVSSEVIDCYDLIETALQTANPLLLKLNTKVLLSRLPDLPPVTVQATAVRQALLHIITMAANYAGQGRIKIEAEAVPNNLSVRLEITSFHSTVSSDHPPPSPSINPDDLEMARKLVQLSKGNLEITQGMQEYSPFQIAITLPTAEQVPVLIIDDNVDTLKLVERYLSGTRYQFSGVAHPDEALEAAQRIDPSLIILDVMLPDKDGWEMLGRLRTHPDTQNVPVIICSILPQSPLALMLGAADFLSKPIRRDLLLSTLDRLTGLASTKSE